MKAATLQPSVKLSLLSKLYHDRTCFRPRLTPAATTVEMGSWRVQWALALTSRQQPSVRTSTGFVVKCWVLCLKNLVKTAPRIGFGLRLRSTAKTLKRRLCLAGSVLSSHPSGQAEQAWLHPFFHHLFSSIFCWFSSKWLPFWLENLVGFQWWIRSQYAKRND